MPISLNDLRNRAVIIRDEVLSAKNTALRVGSLLYDLINKIRGYETDFHSHTNKTVLDQLTDSMGTNNTQAGGKLKYRGQTIESTPTAISTWISTPVDKIVDVLPTTPNEGSRFILTDDGRIYVYESAVYSLDTQTDPETISGSAVIVRTDENDAPLNHIFIYENGIWVDRDVDYNSTRFMTNYDSINGRHAIQFAGSPNNLTQSGLYYGSDNVVGSPLYDSEGDLSTAPVMYEVISIDILNCKQIAYKGDVMYVRDLVAGVWSEWMNNLPIGLISVTYNELLTKVNNGELEPGTNYIITDFRTVHHILDNNTSRTGDINIGSLEPLIVKAVNTNELDKEAISTVYPKDVIYYSITSDIRDIAFYNDDQSPVTDYKGQIYFRHDTIQNVSTWYDFRNVKFRRWTVDAELYEDGSIATYTGFVDGMTTDITLEADNIGVDGNSISLLGDGIKDVDTLVSDWNTANPTNNVTLTAGDDTQVPSNGFYMTLEGGVNPIAYIAKDVCKSGVDGKIYKCITATTGEGDPTVNTADWVLWLDTTINWSWTSDKTLFNVGDITTDNLTMSIPIDLFTFGDYYEHVKDVHIGRNDLSVLINLYGVITTLNNIIFNTEDGISCIGNTFGEVCFNNTIERYFISNTIGNGFISNTIEDTFQYNNIREYFNSNTIGNNFKSNNIENSFRSNTIGNNFKSNNIGGDFDSNTIGDSFRSNTIGNNFYSNTIGNDFRSNTIEDYFSSNTIKFYITDINFTSATHVYQPYDCEIFKRLGGDIRLRYTDSSDVILTVAPTD